jgi:hypothetical protein
MQLRERRRSWLEAIKFYHSAKRARQLPYRRKVFTFWQAVRQQDITAALSREVEETPEAQLPREPVITETERWVRAFRIAEAALAANTALRVSWSGRPQPDLADVRNLFPTPLPPLSQRWRMAFERAEAALAVLAR